LNYRAIYDAFIEDRRQHPTNEVYSTVHHILPRVYGGTDDLSNLIRLGYRDHLFAHKLLKRFGMSVTACKEFTRILERRHRAQLATAAQQKNASGKLNPVKAIHKIFTENQKTIDAMIETFTKDFHELFRETIPGYYVELTRSKKFMNMMRDTAAHMKLYLTPQRTSPLPDNEFIYITRAGKSIIRSAIISKTGRIHQRFIKSKYWQGLTHQFIYPALIECVEARTVELKNGTYTLPRDDKFTAFASDLLSPAIYGYYKVTRMQPGTYPIETIVNNAVLGMKRMMVQFALTNYNDDASLMMAAFGNTKYPSLAYDAALNDIVEYLAYTPNRKDELKSLLVGHMMQSVSGGTSPSDCLDIRPVLQYAATLFTQKGGTA
jgi:hypothetical protein